MSLLLLLTLPFLTSCAVEDTGYGSAVFSVEVADSASKPGGGGLGERYALDCTATGVSTMSADVKNSAGTVVATGGPWACYLGEGTIYDIPVGTSMSIDLAGKDTSGTTIYTGTVTGVAITAGATTDAGTITLSLGDGTTDTTAPDEPIISSSIDSTTITDNTPDVSGTAEAGSTVELFDTDRTTSLGTATTDTNGDWTITCSTLADGDHSLVANATDLAGNTSLLSGSINFTIDATAPSAPVISSPAGGTTTTDSTPDVSGTAEAASTVELLADSTSLGTATTDADGNWSITPATALSEGAHSLTATATDSAGNPSSASTAVSITVDTTAPTVTLKSPSADATGADINGTVSVTFSETMDTGTITTGTFSIDNGVTGDISFSGSGTIATFTPSPALANSTAYTVSLATGITDRAGNALTAVSWSFTTSAPLSVPTALFEEVQKILADDAAAGDQFGYSVSISGDYAIVGAYREDAGGSNAGAVYIFNRTGTNTWDAGTKIVADDAAAGDYFGHSVSISGDYAVVGAHYEDGGGTNAGAGYIIESHITATPGTGEVSVKWDAVTDATSYNIYYAETSGVTTATGTKVADITGTSYTISGLTPATTYYFIVEADGPGGTALMTGEVSATTN